jgi:hypothetical protein
MTVVKTQSMGSNNGPQVKDLVDKVVTIHVGRPITADVTYKGNTSRKTIIRGDVWTHDLQARTTHHAGVVRFLQDVLVEELEAVGPGAWKSTIIIKPNQAYLFSELDDEQMAIVDTLTAPLPDDDGPSSLGLGPHRPDELAGADEDTPPDPARFDEEPF